MFPTANKTANSPIVKNISPTLLNSKAEIADLFACTLVNQKLTSRYDEIPTKS